MESTKINYFCLPQKQINRTLLFAQEGYFFFSVLADGSSDGLRAYIGNEYECPRGHRFVTSGPEKVVKVASGSGGPKESATKLVTLDNPLYFPCPCR